jgi:hypothetical protein
MHGPRVDRLPFQFLDHASVLCFQSWQYQWPMKWQKIAVQAISIVVQKVRCSVCLISKRLFTDQRNAINVVGVYPRDASNLTFRGKPGCCVVCRGSISTCIPAVASSHGPDSLGGCPGLGSLGGDGLLSATLFHPPTQPPTTAGSLGHSLHLHPCLFS